MHSCVEAVRSGLKYNINTIADLSEKQFGLLQFERQNFLQSLGLHTEDAGYYTEFPDGSGDIRLAILAEYKVYNPEEIIAMGSMLQNALLPYEETNLPRLKGMIGVHNWLNMEAEEVPSLEWEEQLEYFGRIAVHFYRAGYQEKGEYLEKKMLDAFKYVLKRSAEKDDIDFLRGMIFEARSKYYSP